MDLVKERKERLITLIDEKYQEFQKFSSQKLAQSNNSNEQFLKQRLQHLRQRLDAIPRIGKQQFSNLPPQQREQYIQMIEKLTAECSVILNQLQEIEKKQSENTQETTPQKVEIEIQTNSLIKQNDSSQQVSHFIVEALETVRKREEHRKKEKLESLRTSVIQGQRGHLKISSERLLFRLKIQLLQQDTTALETLFNQFEQFFQEKAVLWTREFLKPIFEKAETKCKFLATWNDLKTLFQYHEYIIEECLLFAFAKNLYQQLDRSELQDSTAQEKRKIRLELIDSTEKWNKDLEAKWPQLETVERLRYFVKEGKMTSFDSILEKAKSVGLKEESIIQILLSDKEGKLYLEEFKGDVQQPPKKRVPEEILNGVHTISLAVAKQFYVTERVLFKKFSDEEIRTLYETKDKQLLFSKVNITKVEEFKQYWEEITYFEEDEKQSKPSKPTVAKQPLAPKRSKEITVATNTTPIIEEVKEENVPSTSSKM